MSQIVDNSLQETGFQEVETGEYLVSDTEVLAVENLGTCMGIAAYNPRSGTGYLLHAPTLENDELEEQVERFVAEIADISQPFEVLAGGTMASKYNPLTDERFTEKARETAEQVMDYRGISYETAWNEDPVYNRMVVSPEHGILYDVLES